MKHAGAAPTMTAGRAALIATIWEYTRIAPEASPLEAQKLMYFLQVAGEPLKLRYTAHRYGPYADNLRHVLREVEGFYLVGFGDGSSRVRDAEPLEVVDGVDQVARKFLEVRPETTARLHRVIDLTEGFESMYGLELLATVHWVASEERAVGLRGVVSAVHQWSPRKHRMFSERHIGIALDVLKEKGWIAA